MRTPLYLALLAVAVASPNAAHYKYRRAEFWDAIKQMENKATGGVSPSPPPCDCGEEGSSDQSGSPPPTGSNPPPSPPPCDCGPDSSATGGDGSTPDAEIDLREFDWTAREGSNGGGLNGGGNESGAGSKNPEDVNWVLEIGSKCGIDISAMYSEEFPKVKRDDIIKALSNLSATVRDTMKDFDAHKGEIERLEGDLEAGGQNLADIVANNVQLAEDVVGTLEMVYNRSTCPFMQLGIMWHRMLMKGIDGIDDTCDTAARQFAAHIRAHEEDASTTLTTKEIELYAGNLRADLRCIIDDVRNLNREVSEVARHVAGTDPTFRDIMMKLAVIDGYSNILEYETSRLAWSLGIVRRARDELGLNKPQSRSTRTWSTDLSGLLGKTG